MSDTAKLKPLSPKERLSLIHEVSLKAYVHAGPQTMPELGHNLAYLLGVIAGDDAMFDIDGDNPDDIAFYELLVDLFPVGHDVYRYICSASMGTFQYRIPIEKALGWDLDGKTLRQAIIDAADEAGPKEEGCYRVSIEDLDFVARFEPAKPRS